MRMLVFTITVRENEPIEDEHEALFITLENVQENLKEYGYHIEGAKSYGGEKQPAEA